MFKHISNFCFILFVFILIQGCEDTNDETDRIGSIYGIVTDADNGEPIRAAKITLNPDGFSATTGSDGRYEFLNLSPAQYTIQIAANNYLTDTKRITVVADKNVSGDMQLTRGSSKLRVDTDLLDFGTSTGVLSFSVMNVGTSGSVSWTVSNDNNWLSVSPASGSTDVNKNSVVVVTLQGNEITKAMEGVIVVSILGESYGIAVRANVGNKGNVTVVKGGLAAYYTFNDETAIDVTGNGYDGALINSPEFIDDTPNETGKAVFLKKVSTQKLTLESSIKNTNTHTICLWLKDVGAGDVFYGANSNLKLNISNGIFNLHNDSRCRYDGANILQDGNWHHVVVVGKWNGAFWASWSVKLYVDGVLYGSDDNACVSSTLTNNSSSIYIGGENTFKIDNIRFYDRELSSNEIKQIYNAKQ